MGSGLRIGLGSGIVPGRYRYRVLDTRVLLGIGIASIHFLNDRYLKRVGK